MGSVDLVEPDPHRGDPGGSIVGVLVVDGLDVVVVAAGHGGPGGVAVVGPGVVVGRHSAGTRPIKHPPDGLLSNSNEYFRRGIDRIL
jgi:hypothetical protein